MKERGAADNFKAAIWSNESLWVADVCCEVQVTRTKDAGKQE
jgi:hypothetical protein